jgi:hypothetical protein
MPIIQNISNRYKLYVPTVLSGFVSSDKQDCGSSRIKRIQDAVRFPGMFARSGDDDRSALAFEILERNFSVLYNRFQHLGVQVSSQDEKAL